MSTGKIDRVGLKRKQTAFCPTTFIGSKGPISVLISFETHALFYSFSCLAVTKDENFPLRALITRKILGTVDFDLSFCRSILSHFLTKLTEFQFKIERMPKLAVVQSFKNLRKSNSEVS